MILFWGQLEVSPKILYSKIQEEVSDWNIGVDTAQSVYWNNFRAIKAGDEELSLRIGIYARKFDDKSIAGTEDTLGSIALEKWTETRYNVKIFYCNSLDGTAEDEAIYSMAVLTHNILFYNGNMELLRDWFESLGFDEKPGKLSREGILKTSKKWKMPIAHIEPEPIANAATIAAQTVEKQIQVFFSYAHEDEELRNELAKHLSPLERQGLIQLWYDRKISAGTELERQIDTHLNNANIILLLISADFLNSDYCNAEMKRAIERHDIGEAHVIPIILRECQWKEVSQLKKLKALPTDGKPVTSWANRDEAFTDLAESITQVVKEIHTNL